MLTPRRLLLVAVLIGIAGSADRPRAQGPGVVFHGIGDLPGAGGVGSAVRDATRVGGTIYAVGASTVNATAAVGAVPNLDTPALWTWPGSGTGTLEALPYFAGVSNTQNTARSAYAITTDGAYIASQAQPTTTTTGTNWVRVTRSLLPDPSANLNLSLGTGVPAFAALAISDDGLTTYGQRQIGGGTPTETRVPVRFEVGVGGNHPDLTSTGKTWGYPIPRGTSADGLVMVGYASTGATVVTATPGGPTGSILGTNAVAFRYQHNAGTLSGTTSLIPMLPDGGTWNMPVALSATGDRTVVIGNSTRYPNGEVYLTDAANTITATLGSPNTAWMPRVLGGMTGDGSVIAVTFAGMAGFGPAQIAGLGIPSGPNVKHAYIHNSHGWFHFSSILLSHGIDLSALGWDPGNLAITGIRTVDGVDLVFGQGRRRTMGPAGLINGPVEGFVAELPQGVLASFNPQPTAPADQSLVGAWAVGDPSAATIALIFLADGTSYRITSAGFERNLYTWTGNANGGAFTQTTLLDTDGGGGSNRNGESGLSFIVSGDVATFNIAGFPPGTTFTPLTRITGSAGSIAGGWIGHGEPEDTLVVALLETSAGNTIFQANDFAEFSEGGVGTYTWDPVSHELIVTESNGHVDDGNFVTLSRDELRVHVVGDDGEEFDLTRVIDPRTPFITSALAATATTGLPFAYQIAATNSPSTFGVVGLPAGLNVDMASGVISGTPAETGTFDVLIEASNDVSTSTGRNHLSLVVIAPVVISGTGPIVVTPIPPEAGEPPPVTIQFTNVTGGGEVSVATIDPATVLSAPDPPAGFALGDNPVYYEITTTATFEGPVTVCFSYAGVTFAGFPTLLHYDEDLESWVDITTSVDTDRSVICGLTSSFSPFLIAASALDGAGFHPPIEPVAGAINTVKGGATVPLKFNVYGAGGVEITDPANISNLAFHVTRIVCESGAQEDPIPFQQTGGTSLRYDATSGHFVQNWKTPPNVAGVSPCYLVKVTGDGLLLSARFKVK